MSAILERPAADEFAPFYAGYISRVPDGNIVATLDGQIADTLSLLRAIPEARGVHRYAPDKWSIKEIVGHMCDTERVMAYRALRMARGDQTPLASFDQDPWVKASRFDERSMASLTTELEHVRWTTIDLLRPLDEDALLRRGTASGVTLTPRSLAYIIAGHERHHVAVLRERYL